jgi:serine/threonine-protein kinase
MVIDPDESPVENPLIAVGRTVGNYMITAKLGEGGMGVVYLAEHPVIGRKVALKAIHPELLRNPEVVSRFVTEAKAVNQIGNDHIVDIHDFGTTPSGEFYFIMEFLQGEALSDHLKHAAPMEASRALAIVAQVADALAASHQHGIIHRDLKPENIFLINKSNSKDFVKVLDFGLAKLTQGEEKVTHKTRTGSVMGTPYYMSPEQCEGKANIDHRADIYSLGVILFEMMTGKVPFGGEGYGEIIVKHITSPIPSVRACNPLLESAHELLVRRALAKSRDARFQTMEDFSAACLDPKGYAATVPSPKTPTPVALSSLAASSGPPRERADSVISGQVLFGKPNAPENTEAPFAYRASTNELSDESLESLVKPRRRGLWIALLGAAAMAGSLAYYLTRPMAADETPPPPPVALPVVAKTVKISFQSVPAGADVLRKDNGEQLGVTPFVLELPVDKTSVDVIYKKDEFKEETRSYVPETAQIIAVTLTPVPPQVIETPTKVESKPQPAKTAIKAPSKRSPVSKERRTNRILDEDGVLAPSF